MGCLPPDTVLARAQKGYAMLHILVVEDDLLVATLLEDLIIETVQAVVVITASLAGTEKVLHDAFDLVFLDVEVTDGETYEIAKQLKARRVPYVFVSGTSVDRLPPELKASPFIAKPYRREQIERALFARDLRRPGPITDTPC